VVDEQFEDMYNIEQHEADEEHNIDGYNEPEDLDEFSD
jgi:hypothetical protein